VCCFIQVAQCPSDKQAFAIQYSQALKALLSISRALVFESYQSRVEKDLKILEVNTMVSQILEPLRLIPC
jgi:hypothetical protein